MPTLTTRQEARARLLQIAQIAIERLVPADEQVPLRGATFADFENQSYEVGDELIAAMMEERAKLERNAAVEKAGCCPYCGSPRTYLEEKGAALIHEIRSPSGPVLIARQGARCRACDGSFSPSTQRLATMLRSGAHAPRRAPRGARNRDPDL
jgi:hypothetical protein